ncbi:MAG: Rab family GTPase [Candidatus Hodarchaeota archaeon]
MSISKDYAYLAKAVLIGDGATGKTSLAENFCHGFFSTAYLMTVGANFYSEIIQIGKNGEKVKVLIWDLAGQPHFKEVRSLFYLGTMICLAVFDLTRFSSLMNLEHWFNDMYMGLEEPAIPTILIGNKVDLEEERSIDNKEVVRFIKSLYIKYPGYKNMEIPYIETSAKTGENVEKAFRMVTEIFVNAIKESEEELELSD